MLEPFAPVVALVLFDAEPSTVESLRDRLLLPPPTPHDAPLTLLRSVDFARRHNGPVVPWAAWTPTFQGLAQRDWEDATLRHVLWLASCSTPSDLLRASRSTRGPEQSFVASTPSHGRWCR